jgi:hypothetical protein
MKAVFVIAALLAGAAVAGARARCAAHMDVLLRTRWGLKQ